VNIGAKVDYAIRALLELAQHSEPMNTDALAKAQNLPVNFLGAILNDLRRAGFVISHRGIENGYSLARPANQIMVADVIRTVDGPLIEVRRLPLELISYEGGAEHLGNVWIALRDSLSAILEPMTLEHVARGTFPKPTPAPKTASTGS
jgi:Rrf2 family protein